MLKINERFSLQRDRYQWIVHEYRPSKNPRTGEDTLSHNKSYFPKFEQACNHILENTAEGVEVLEDMKEMLETTFTDIRKLVDQLGEPENVNESS